MSDARLLYLGNGTKLQSVAMLDDRFESWGLTVDRYWAYSGEFPNNLDSYDGIFLSGSPHGAYEDIPFIHREHSLIKDASARAFPCLAFVSAARYSHRRSAGATRYSSAMIAKLVTRIFR